VRLEVLGCSGGIGRGLRTTSLAIDDDILIDCGTGIGDLPVERLREIRRVFLTHAHLDHVAGLPLLADTVFDTLKSRPLAVHCEDHTHQVLREHIFNWRIWPDFFVLPRGQEPALHHVPFHPGDVWEDGERRVEAIRMEHTVPAMGYFISNGRSAIAFTGDTTRTERFWQVLNARPRLDVLIIECAFGNEDIEVCRLAKHYCPTILAEELERLEHDPLICITHLKPGCEQAIFEQVERAIGGRRLLRLRGGEHFDL